MKSVAISNDKAITTVPANTEWKIFPFLLATMNDTQNGIVAKSPNGKTLLPGIMIANSKVIGTKINHVEMLEGCPIDTAASRPIYKSLPL